MSQILKFIFVFIVGLGIGVGGQYMIGRLPSSPLDTPPSGSVTGTIMIVGKINCQPCKPGNVCTLDCRPTLFTDDSRVYQLEGANTKGKVMNWTGFIGTNKYVKISGEVFPVAWGNFDGRIIIEKMEDVQDIIPIDGTPIQDETGQLVYFVCKEIKSAERIYLFQRCGTDTCADSFFNSSGGFIEKAGEGMVPNSQKPKTQVDDCVRTTKEYFESKIKDKNNLPTE